MVRDDIDVLNAGSGPLAVLVHSSVSGARQWRKLMDVLAPRFHVVAPNLYGYGQTPPWPGQRPQTLRDLALIVEAVVPRAASGVALVGHSLGASVAMAAARALGSRVDRLVLIEPNPFHLLRDNGRADAFAEIMGLRDIIKTNAARGTWTVAAEAFADYWGGAGTWAGMSDERRAAFTGALPPNGHEWDAVLGETTPLSELVSGLPKRTLVLWDPATVRPIREIVAVMQAGTPWQFEELAGGGHMSPLTRPDLVNPMVQRFIES